ncbi:MAG: ketol-acid reductoisomerase [Pirellulales bacterium]|nr:ketol-acid reductoisomerase [Pirellulales bacterium]
MDKFFTETDANKEALRDRRVVVLGYGSQGRGQALNLRDSGVDVAVGLRSGGTTWAQAEGEGWEPVPVETAVEGADVVCLLVPDMDQPELYQQHVAPHLKPGAAVVFAHGFNIHYDAIAPADNVDVIMVAPKGPGALVREQFEQGRGVPCLFAVHQDATGSAAELALAYADAIGGTRAGVMQTTFREETETDLFGEQAVLCGGATELVCAGWETLVEAGYDPQLAYFECLHELKLIVDLLYEGGLARMHKFVSDTAKYGDLSRGKRVIDEQTRQRMKEILAEIQDGRFAKEWREEHATGSKNYHAMLQADLDHPIEQVGQQLRSRFAWIRQEEGATA